MHSEDISVSVFRFSSRHGAGQVVCVAIVQQLSLPRLVPGRVFLGQRGLYSLRFHVGRMMVEVVGGDMQ
jgi:hypothetical protein